MFAVSRSCAPTAATSQRSRLYSTEVRASAMPAAIHAHIPAIEIVFGETLRSASQVVADCAHFRFRVAIGRRSIAFAADLFIAGAIHSRVPGSWPDNTSAERRAFRRCAPFLHISPSFGMMQSHACNAGANRAEHSHAAFNVYSAILQHGRPMVRGVADHVLRLRDPVLDLDQRVWNGRAVGILSDARSQGPAELQNHRNDLWRGDACRKLLLFLQNRTGRLI